MVTTGRRDLRSFAELPGYDLIRQGVDDLVRGDMHSVAALLVTIGSPRLRDIGVGLPDALPDHPEHRLYDRLSDEGTDTAHGRYNALIRRLVSFERAAEHATTR